MSKQIYTVVVEYGRDSDIVYAGTDPYEATACCKRHVDEGTAFIEVWRDGEHQYTTRENPAQHG